MKKLTNAIVGFLRIVCTVLIVSLGVVVALQIVSRVFKISMPWAEELARFALVWLTFVGCSLGIYTKGHLGVNFIVEKLPNGVRKAVMLLAKLVIIAFFLILLVYGIKLSQTSMKNLSSTMRWPMGWVYSVIPFSAVFSLYFQLVDLLDLLRPEKEKNT